MSEHEQKPENRSSALSPEALGAINMATAAAVKEAVAGVFAALGPMLAAAQNPTPGISVEQLGASLREAMRPWKDPKDIEREIREMVLWKEDEAANRAQIQARQDGCPHIDDNGRSAVQLVHNFPDQHPRGLCVHCQALIHPKEWRIGAPTKEFPRGKPYLVAPHKNYQMVIQQQNRQ